MRKIVYCLVLASMGTLGCSLPGDKARCGFHFEVIKPPTINTESPVLVQTGQPIVGAHPMGTVSGPVQEGQFLHGPAQPTPTVPVPPRSMMRMPIGGVCDPYRPGGVLTVEEWCRIQQQQQQVKPLESK